MKELITFFLLAFAISTVLILPQAAADYGLISWQSPTPLVLAVGFGPAAAALIVAGLSGGKREVRQLFASLFRWRFPFRWYLVAFLLPPALIVAAVAIDVLLGGEFDLSRAAIYQQSGMSGPGVWLLFIPILLIQAIVLVGEELGWRGYALPRLQVHYNALVSSLILGILWGLWHLPLALAPSTGAGVAFLPLGWFIADIIGSSIMYTWLYNNSRGSTLLATLTHAVNNTAVVFIPFIPVEGGPLRPFFIVILLRWLVSLLIIWRAGALNLGPARAVVPEAAGQATEMRPG